MERALIFPGSFFFNYLKTNLFTNEALSLGARYTYGLTKVGKERIFMGTSYTFPDAKNGVASVYVSFSLSKN